MISETQRKELKKWRIISRHAEAMDREIVDVILDLNRNGFDTMSSCAGHGEDRGLITFKQFPKGEKLKKVIAIMEVHGLKRIQVSESIMTHIPYIGFTSIGKRIKEW